MIQTCVVYFSGVTLRIWKYTILLFTRTIKIPAEPNRLRQILSEEFHVSNNIHYARFYRIVNDNSISKICSIALFFVTGASFRPGLRGSWPIDPTFRVWGWKHFTLPTFCALECNRRPTDTPLFDGGWNGSRISPSFSSHPQAYISHRWKWQSLLAYRMFGKIRFVQPIVVYLFYIRDKRYTWLQYNVYIWFEYLSVFVCA